MCDPFTLNPPTHLDDEAANLTAEQRAAYYDAALGEYVAPGWPTTEVSCGLEGDVERAASTPPTRLTPEVEEWLARTACGDRELLDSRMRAAEKIRRQLVTAGLMTDLGIVTGRGLWLLRLIRDESSSPSQGLARQALDARKADGWGPDVIDGRAQGRI